MKLFYSDLHLRPERLDDCKLVLKKIGETAAKIQDTAKTKVTIINGGDTFNTRGLIHTNCFDALYREFENWKRLGLHQWIIVGNHDQEDKAGSIHPMSVFQSWDGWEVIDRPRRIGRYALFPYMPDRELAKAKLKQFNDNGAIYAVVHWGIRGAHMNDFKIDTEGFPVEWLKDYNKVFSGHYHYRSEFENVQYIGSPFQQTFAEMNQDKGILLWDGSNSKFIEIKGTPKYREVDVVSGESPKFSWDEGTDVKNDYIRVNVKGDVDFVRSFDKSTMDFGREIKIRRMPEARHTSRLNIEAKEILSPTELADKYVGYIETTLDKKKLLTMGRGIIND